VRSSIERRFEFWLAAEMLPVPINPRLSASLVLVSVKYHFFTTKN
jgi:hypothetical protein